MNDSQNSESQSPTSSCVLTSPSGLVPKQQVVTERSPARDAPAP